MKAKTMLPLVIGVVFGFVAIKLGFDAIQRARGSAAPTELVSVVVANTDIESTAELVSEMLVVKKTPASPLAPPDAFSSADDLVGRVAAKGIPWGSPILPSMLSPKGTKPGLQVRIQEGYRAVSVKVDEVTGVAYNLRPGDYVDVIAVMTLQGARGKQTVSNVILQRVQVGGVGQWLDAPDQKESKVKSVTLLVKEEEVPKLHLAQSKGKVTLAMRAPDDERISKFSSAYESELTGRDDTLLARATAPASMGALLNPDQFDPMTPREWVVTVFNGPVRAGDGESVHRLTYEDTRSMKVVNATTGRSDSGHSAVSAESIMTVRRDDLAGRRERRLGEVDQPNAPADAGAGGTTEDAT